MWANESRGRQTDEHDATKHERRRKDEDIELTARTDELRQMPNCAKCRTAQMPNDAGDAEQRNCRTTPEMPNNATANDANCQRRQLPSYNRLAVSSSTRRQPRTYGCVVRRLASFGIPRSSAFCVVRHSAQSGIRVVRHLAQFAPFGIWRSSAFGAVPSSSDLYIFYSMFL